MKEELTTYFKDKIIASSAKLLFSSDILSSSEKSRTHFDKLRCVALFTLKSEFLVSLKQDFPQIVGVRSLYNLRRGWPPFSYFTPTCPAISLPPHPLFPFFHCGVLFHVTLATQWLCSALHSAGILLPWRADALCLSSCHPHQKSPCGRLHQTPV